MTTSNRAFPYLLFLLALLSVLPSCNKFLEEQPSKSTLLVVKTIEDLNGLLNAQNAFYDEPNFTMIFSTDDYGLTTGIYDARRATFSALSNLQYMLWDTLYLPDVGESFWSGEWAKIFTANLVLNSLDQVSGAGSEKAVIRADAHFVRAYSYWLLANTYCLPFNEKNRNEPGLPLKMSTSFEEDVRRKPLEQVYQMIEADLAEALKIPVSLTQTGKARNWRASKAGVNAFAARYYLNRNDNAKAVQYANAALEDHSTLVDYNTDMRYGNSQSVTIDPGTPNARTVVLQYPYTHNNPRDQTNMIGWKETLYYRFLTNGYWWFLPSNELLDLYDKDHDLRYRYHIVEGYSYDRGMTLPSYDHPGYIFFYKDRIPSGPTVAEVLLTKAEALARSGDVPGAMSALNTLRSKRMLPGAWVNLTAANREEAVKKVMEERRREMPFVQRWFDIRRYNNNDDSFDDVVLSRSFYPYNMSSVLFNEPVRTYTLPTDSRRYAAPIPRTEIISSNGAIQQNRY